MTKLIRLIPVLAFAILFTPNAHAQNLGNAWHVPTNTVPGGPTMRDPVSGANTGATVTIYSGNQFQGSGNPGDQSGGVLFYKAQSSSSPYLSVPLQFFSQSGNDKFWRASFTAPSSANGVIQYFLQINYGDGHANTFLYGNDTTSNVTASETFAGTNAFTFQTTATLTVNGVNANYTTSHLFIDEIAGDSLPLTVVFHPNIANVDPATVQVFTNVNRREFARLPYTDASGIATEEGISPPSGDVVGDNDNHYYRAYPMAGAGDGRYTFTLGAGETGAYRLTARYRLNGSGTWIYYTSDGRRDHAVVVSPKAVRDIKLYEINTLNINATGAQMAQRSTFADLHNPAKRWNLQYLKQLGSNYLWFQPIHPNGIDGRQIDPTTGQPFSVGSPYAVKNFFEVMELMGQGITRSSARSEFQGFVAAADAESVGVMLDAPYNHTSYDVELAQQGVALIKPGASATAEIRSQDARFFSSGDIFDFENNDYCQRAANASDIGPAPDRNDFGKFGDTFDVFYGRYSALVCRNNEDNGNYNNEGDAFFYNDTTWTSTDFVSGGVNHNITRNVWRYFADYIPYWITQTGHSGTNSTAANGDAAARLALDSKGVDALRADFGQGLPPQAWEYIINVARSQKWNFVFMTESLDGGAVTYRSNRHFDILNENIIFPFKAATQTSQYRGIFDERRNAYGQGLVLLNNTSHDEENYDDPFQALIRYGVSSTIDGVPMIFYGQENGVSRTFGYSRYETNFGKQITHFKVFNDLGPILGNQTFGLQQLSPVYQAMNEGRQFSRALRSSNRFYLNQVGGSVQQSIFSIAKYEVPNGSPVSSDVVFGFVNLDRNNNQQGNFNLNVDANGLNLFGIKRGRTYDVKNIAAYTALNTNRRNVFLNRKSGDQLLDGGFFVGLNKVPAADSEWTSAPYEAQYLKLYDVTTPTTAPGIPRPANLFGYTIAGATTLSWAPPAPDSEGIQWNYKVTFTFNNQNFFIYTSATSYTFMVPAGLLSVSIQAVNPNEDTTGNPPLGPASMTSVQVLDGALDQDGDGKSNADEDNAATNPLDPNSRFEVTDVTKSAAGSLTITWSSVSGKTYQVESCTAPGNGCTPAGDSLVAGGNAETRTVSASGPFYRVRVNP